MARCSICNRFMPDCCAHCIKLQVIEGEDHEIETQEIATLCRNCAIAISVAAKAEMERLQEALQKQAWEKEQLL